MTRGYAVIVNGEINLRTVGTTVRMAMVNGLAAIFDIMPMDHWTNRFISQMWAAMCRGRKDEIKIIEVEVRAI